MKDHDKLYAMKLHEEFAIRDGQHVMRVPGGWLYINSYRIAFVPMNREFHPSRLETPVDEF